MQPWPLGASDRFATGPAVSAGTAKGFTNLMGLSDGTRSLPAAVAAIPAGATIYVTGHSLGGTLAPVVALWMTELPNGLVPQVYCYAGMTPGNQAFADLFGPGTKLAGRVRRYSNTLDSVPYGWDRVMQTRDFYQPAPRGGALVEAAVSLLAYKLTEYGYAPIGEEIPLQGVLSDRAIGCEIVAFVIENLSQHLPDTYLSLLGAPPLPFMLGVGSVVGPRAHPTASAVGKKMLPVYFM